MVIRSVDELGNISYKNNKGQLHRVDGPALIWNDGSVFWYYEDKFHCTNGPAIIHANNGKKGWCIHGIRYTNESEYLKEVRKIKFGIIVDDSLTD